MTTAEDWDDEDWDPEQETQEVLSDPALMASIAEGEATIGRGDEGIPLDEVEAAFTRGGKQGLIDLEEKYRPHR